MHGLESTVEYILVIDSVVSIENFFQFYSLIVFDNNR